MKSRISMAGSLAALAALESTLPLVEVKAETEAEAPVGKARGFAGPDVGARDAKVGKKHPPLFKGKTLKQRRKHRETQFRQQRSQFKSF